MIRIIQGDITEYPGDILVNAAKPSLLGGGGVDGAIHRAAGPGLLMACKQLQVVQAEPVQTHRCLNCYWQGEPLRQQGTDGSFADPWCPACEGDVTPLRSVTASGEIRCPTGEARITPAFNLPCRAVIHTVGPIYRKDNPAESERLLREAITQSFDLAYESRYRGGIAFPAISCGVYGYPVADAAGVLVGEALKWEPHFDEIVFVLFDQEILNIFQKTFKMLSHLREHPPGVSGA